MTTMNEQQITGWVDCLLESWAVQGEGDERGVYSVLRDLLMAWAHYELMSDQERALVTALCKKMQHYFDTKCMLKERKRKSTKEKFPLKPLLKEKEKKEIEKKPRPCVCDAKEAFRLECQKYGGQYDKQLVNDFFYYFTEPTKSGKMLFEEQKHWSTKNRLARWVNNAFSSDNMAAAERLKKARGRQAKEQADTKAQQEQIAQREEANARLEAEIEERKAGAVSRAEWEAIKAAREKGESDHEE